MFTGGRGALTVSVRDRVSNRPLAGGRVTLQSASAVFTSTETDSLAGLYTFAAVPVGRYQLQTARIGYRAARDSVTIALSASDTLRIMLSVDDCDIACSAIVVTRRPWWQFWRR